MALGTTEQAIKTLDVLLRPEIRERLSVAEDAYMALIELRRVFETARRYETAMPALLEEQAALEGRVGALREVADLTAVRTEAGALRAEIVALEQRQGDLTGQVAALLAEGERLRREAAAAEDRVKDARREIAAILDRAR